jgi:hypothetical protein
LILNGSVACLDYLGLDIPPPLLDPWLVYHVYGLFALTEIGTLVLLICYIVCLGFLLELFTEFLQVLNVWVLFLDGFLTFCWLGILFNYHIFIFF